MSALLVIPVLIILGLLLVIVILASKSMDRAWQIGLLKLRVVKLTDELGYATPRDCMECLNKKTSCCLDCVRFPSYEDYWEGE